MTPLWQLTLARFREFYRRPAAIFWTYGFPLVLALILGGAFSGRSVERLRVDVRSDGPGGSAAAEAARAALAADERLTVTVGDEATAKNRLRTTKTDLVLTPGGDGGADAYLSDPGRPDSAQARAAVQLARVRAASPGVARPTEATLDEPGGRYIDFLIPGLIGLNLMGGGLWGVGFVTVDMRVRMLLKRFMATPMRRSDFLLSLLLSRLVFTIIGIGLLLGFAYAAFDVRVRGNPLTLAAVVAVGGAAFSGIGLLVACRASTIETISGLMNAVMLPMYLFSGVFFSTDRYPDWAQPVLQLLPLTALNNALRAVMTDGDGIVAIARPMALLVAWGVVSFFLALRLFRWR